MHPSPGPCTSSTRVPAGGPIRSLLLQSIFLKTFRNASNNCRLLSGLTPISRIFAGSAEAGRAYCSYNSVFYKYHSYNTYYTYNTKYNTNYIIKYYTNNGLRRGSGELFLKKLANFVETRTEKLLLNCAPAIGLMHVHPQVLPISLASLSGKLRHCCLLPAHRNARRRKI